MVTAHRERVSVIDHNYLHITSDIWHLCQEVCWRRNGLCDETEPFRGKSQYQRPNHNSQNVTSAPIVTDISPQISPQVPCLDCGITLRDRTVGLSVSYLCAGSFCSRRTGFLSTRLKQKRSEKQLKLTEQSDTARNRHQGAEEKPGFMQFSPCQLLRSNRFGWKY